MGKLTTNKKRKAPQSLVSKNCGCGCLPTCRK